MRTFAGLVFSAIFTFHLFAGSSSPDAQNSPTFHPAAAQGLEDAYLSSPFPASHAANLLLLKNNDLLCFWFSGAAEGQSDVGIMMSRLPHGGNTWSKAVLLDHQEGRSFQNPVGFQDQSGKVWLFHTSQAAGQGQADAQVLLLFSTDNGESWSRPSVLFSQAGSYTRQPLVLMDDGAWMLPMYYTPSAGITKGAQSNYSVVKISNDQGKTWRECRIPDSEGLVQPSVVKLRRHAYLVFLRSRYADFIYQASSSDGCIWSKPVPTALPNNNASIQAARLSDGHLVMAFDNSSTQAGRTKPQTAKRFPLSVALSVDEGKTWRWVRDLETGTEGSSGNDYYPLGAGRDEYSYPAILQMPDGRIISAYTYRRLAIKAVRFNESWIRQGSTSGLFHGASSSEHAKGSVLNQR
ncbi:MAG TPA: sialidase family protein [Acidobacteriaceae bacterium]|nr:sialidase family protein [Acidobacteriaceae bacterium]